MAAETDTEPGDLPALGSRVQRRVSRPRWWARPFVVIAAVTAVAGGLRFYHLSSPRAYVFDEVYYAKDGCFLAGFPYEQCGLENPGEQTITVHPPLGRWIIAGGVAATGASSDFRCEFGKVSPRCNPFGFRVAAATFGTLSVLLLAMLAYLLFGRALWAGIAGLLLATESLNFVQSRTSMLDIFLVTFVVAGFLFLVLDRRWIDRRTPLPSDPAEEGLEEAYLLALPPDRPPAPIWRPWRLAAGLAFGAAVATKWSGATALAAAVLLALAWERTRRSQISLPHSFREAIRDEAFGIFLFFLVVPLAVYMASYAKWFVDHGLDLIGWWDLQRGMASYSIHLRAEHPYASPAWSWLILKRPVAYYYQCFRTGPAGCALPGEILGVGNPVIFWGSLLAVPYALVSWIRKRDWRAGLIVLAFSVQYAPWFFAARTNFLFYLAPVTPFMVLAGAYALKDLSEVELGTSRVRALAPVAAFLLVIAVGLFVFFLPVLTGRPISQGQWKLRMWFPSWI